MNTNEPESRPALKKDNANRSRVSDISRAILSLIFFTVLFHKTGFGWRHAFLGSLLMVLFVGTIRLIGLFLVALFLAQALLIVGVGVKPYIQSVHWDFLAALIGFVETQGVAKASIFAFILFVGPLFLLQSVLVLIHRQFKNPYEDLIQTWIKRN